MCPSCAAATATAVTFFFFFSFFSFLLMPTDFTVNSGLFVASQSKRLLSERGAVLLSDSGNLHGSPRVLRVSSQ